MNKKNDDLTIKEFADELEVPWYSVYDWVLAGKVKGKKKGPFPGKTSPIFIPVSELERVRKLMEASQKESS